MITEALDMMYMIVRDSKGNRSECMLMASDQSRMRVAFRGGDDAVELRRQGDRWIQEGYGPVEVESFVAGDRPLIVMQPDAEYLLAG
jgi:hypothetical protein